MTTPQNVRDTTAAIRTLKAVDNEEKPVVNEKKLEESVAEAIKDPPEQVKEHVPIIVTPAVLADAQRRRDDANVESDIDQYNNELITLEDQMHHATQTIEWIDTQTDLLRQMRAVSTEEIALLKIRIEAKHAAIDMLRKQGHR